MSTPAWITKAGLLGTVTERTAVSIPLVVKGTQTNFSLISGSLPSGLVLKKETTSTNTTTIGYIVGNPTTLPTTIRSQFVIRAQNSFGVSDRTFLLDAVGGTDPLWLTPEGYLHVGTSGECFAVNKQVVDYQLSALPNVLFENMKLRYYISEDDGQLPNGLRLSEDGRIFGIVNEQTVIEGTQSLIDGGYDNEQYDKFPYDSAVVIDNVTSRPKFIKKVYQFYVTATDGFNSAKKLFRIQVVDHNSLRGDTSYINADSECFQAGNSYLFSPNWLSPANLGIRRANNYQIITIKTYDPFPEIGGTRWSWDNVSVNPEIRAVADTQANDGPDGLTITVRGSVEDGSELISIFGSNGDLYRVLNTGTNYVWSNGNWQLADYYPKYNRAGTSTVHLKNLTSLPQVGQQFRLDSYLPFANSTTYTITYVTGTTEFCQLGFKHSPREVNDEIIYDTRLETDIPDNTVLFLGSPSVKPLGLELNPLTGDLYGRVPYIPAYSLDYKFTVRMTKTDNSTGNTIKSDRVFQLRLQGSIDNTLEWITTSTVGSIKTGYQSELSIRAEDTVDPNLGVTYQLIDGSLPEGLEFKSDGSIVGKLPYGSTTEIDSKFTDFTIDEDQTTLDRTFNFTAKATNSYRLEAVEQQFTVKIDDNDLTPFSSVYVRPFMYRDKRRSYRNFINDTDIFDQRTLYRPTDPAFGLQKEIKMVLEYGIERLNLAEYIVGLQNYFYNKRFYFGDVKTLPAKDDNGKYVYDLVYVDIVDTAVNSSGKGPDKVNFIINQKLVDLYANSVDNWQRSLESIQIYGNQIKVDEYLRPRFMRTIQESTGSPLGFIKAVPICYVKPGEGFKTVRRIQLSGFDFKLLDFEVDRLIIDKTLDFDGDKYLKFPIKTIDGARPVNVLAGPDGVIITDENGNELFVE